MLTAYLVVAGVVFFISACVMFHWVGQFKGTTELISEGRGGYSNGIWVPVDGLPAVLDKERTAMKRGLYGMLLAPVWPVAVLAIPCILLWKFVCNTAEAINIVIKEK